MSKPKAKPYVPTVKEELHEMNGRLSVLEANAERQSVVTKFLMDELKRVIREKEVLMIHMGMAALAKEQPPVLSDEQRVLANKSNELLRALAQRVTRGGL